MPVLLNFFTSGRINRVVIQKNGANIGSKYDIFCSTEGDKRWYFSTRNINSYVLLSKENILRIKRVTPKHMGLYKCYGLQERQYVKMVMLTVYGKRFKINILNVYMLEFIGIEMYKQVQIIRLLFRTNRHYDSLYIISYS